MSCALTADILIDCREGMGGLLKIYPIEFANVTALTVVDGVVTGITKVATKQFREYQLPRETGSMTSTIQGDDKTGTLYFSHECKIVVNKLTSQIRKEIILIAKNRLMIVGRDNNGKFWLIGREAGVLVGGGNLGTGVAAGDRSGAELDFSGVESEPMIEVDAATAATLTTPGA